MKITSIDTHIAGNPWKNWLFTQVHTDQGITGTGEGTINGFARTVEAAIHEMSPLVIDMDPHDVDEIVLRLRRDLYTQGGQLQSCAIAAIEIACWDIMGKAAGKPVHKLMGGACRERVRTYANGWYRGPRTPESFHEKARQVVARGYTALKFDPFGQAYRFMTPDDEALSLDIIAAVRDAVGPQVDLLIEAHCRFSVGYAIRLGEKLAKFDPTWFEEPTPHHKVDAVVEVARRVPVPVATGESFWDIHQLAELLSHNAVHILQPDPVMIGGLSTAKAAAQMADAHFAIVAPHNAQGPVCTASCLQLAACCTNFFIQEVFDEFNEDWEADVARPAFTSVDGHLPIPTEPGLGIELNLDVIKAHPYHLGHNLQLFRAGWETREGTRRQDENASAAASGAAR